MKIYVMIYSNKHTRFKSISTDSKALALLNQVGNTYKPDTISSILNTFIKGYNVSQIDTSTVTDVIKAIVNSGKPSMSPEFMFEPLPEDYALPFSIPEFIQGYHYALDFKDNVYSIIISSKGRNSPERNTKIHDELLPALEDFMVNKYELTKEDHIKVINSISMIAYDEPQNIYTSSMAQYLPVIDVNVDFKGTCAVISTKLSVHSTATTLGQKRGIRAGYRPINAVTPGSNIPAQTPAQTPMLIPGITGPALPPAKLLNKPIKNAVRLKTCYNVINYVHDNMKKQYKAFFKQHKCVFDNEFSKNWAKNSPLKLVFAITNNGSKLDPVLYPKWPYSYKDIYQIGRNLTTYIGYISAGDDSKPLYLMGLTGKKLVHIPSNEFSSKARPILEHSLKTIKNLFEFSCNKHEARKNALSVSADSFVIDLKNKFAVKITKIPNIDLIGTLNELHVDPAKFDEENLKVISEDLIKKLNKLLTESNMDSLESLVLGKGESINENGLVVDSNGNIINKPKAADLFFNNYIDVLFDYYIEMLVTATTGFNAYTIIV